MGRLVGPVETLDLELDTEGGYVIAVDAAGAGVVDVWLHASGSSAR